MSRPLAIAVTGASGFVGSAIVDALRSDASYVCRALYRSLPERPIEGVEQVRVGDLANGMPPASALRNVDVVIHTAARTHVLRERVVDPHAAYRMANVNGTVNLANAAVEAGVRRLVFLSSIKVNGESTPIDRPFTEEDAPAPEDAYGITKLEAERRLLEFGSRTGLEVVSLRPPLVYGSGVKGNLAQLMQLVRRGVPLPLRAIRNKRSFVNLHSLTSAILTAALHPDLREETFLVSDQDDISTAELVVALAKGFGRNAALWPAPVSLLEMLGRLTKRTSQVARLTGSLRVDSTKLSKVTGWRPIGGAREGLAAMARDFGQSK